MYTVFDLDPGDMKLDRGNDHGRQLCKVSGRQYNEFIVQNLFERSDRYIEPPF